MCRCSMCGRFYIYKTGEPIKRGMVAQGPEIQTEFPEGTCRECRSPEQSDDALVYIGDDDLFRDLVI